jgi:hypothetical protein
MPKFFTKRQPASGKAKQFFKKSSAAKPSSNSKGSDPLALLSDVIPDEKYRERDLVIVFFEAFCARALTVAFADYGNTAQ